MKKLTQEKQTLSKMILSYLKKYSKWLGLPLGLIFLSCLSLALIFLSYQDKIFPRIQINTISMGGLTQDQANTYLNDLTTDYKKSAQIDLLLSDQLKEATTSTTPIFKTLNLNQFNLNYQTDKTVLLAFEIGRTGTWQARLSQLQNLMVNPQNIPLEFELDQAELDYTVDQIAQTLDRPGAKPAIIFDDTTNQIAEVFLGENGIVVDQSNLKETIFLRAQKLSNSPMVIQAQVESNKISSEVGIETKQRADNLLTKTLELSFVDQNTNTEQNWSITGKEIIGLINFSGGFDQDQIKAYVTTLSESINRPPQNATFEFNNGRVVEFIPAVDGLELDIESNTLAIQSALEELENSPDQTPQVKLATLVTPPEIKTEDVNDLGINQLLGRGESSYKGSIAGRVFNVAHTAAKLHGVLVPPGETFSFVNTVGEISAATGYKTAYVIQNGRTVLGDGGGVCQDSTTLFRAIMDAGLPITERKAHSYRVGYYEQNSQPGFDATIFSPTVDLKFKNDTPGHILIQAHADSVNTKLVIELYGTSDGRVSEISNYRQWDAVPAPPPLYQDDPTLPPGTVKQVDWAAPGLKVKFDYTVTRNEEVIFNQTYYSNYRPWQAVYLRGV